MWRDTFPKLLKWNISAFFLILGLYFTITVESTGNVQWMILAVFCFGIVYWLFKAKSDVSWKITATSAAALIVAAGAAVYARNFGLDYGLLGKSFYPSWIAWTFLIGTPAMAFAYKRFG